MKSEDGNASDEDQMVICEETAAGDIDLKCKDELADSENEAHDEKIDQSKEKVTQSKDEVTCRPKAIKGMA